MNRTQFINLLIADHGFSSYLEIGSQNNANFNHVQNPTNCLNKISVDPDPKVKATFCMTSDEYFHMAVPSSPFSESYFGTGMHYDIIFIDGLHHADQVERDIINSIRCLKPGGIIVLHDCNPLEEWHQLVPRQHKEWYGDVWRAFVGFRLKYPDVVSFCMDFDCGCGVIKYTCRAVEPGFITDMPWAEFDKNRKTLLGLI